MQRIYMVLTARRGQRLVSTKGAPSHGQDTARTLRTIMWYKRDCISKNTHTRPLCLAVPKGWSMKISLYYMGWLRSVGSIELYVSFAQEPYKKDNILQKRPTILSILLTEPPHSRTIPKLWSPTPSQLCHSVTYDSSWLRPHPQVGTLDNIVSCIGLFCKRDL